MRDTHPYFLRGNSHKKYVVGEDNGLLILSAYPISFDKEYMIEDCVIPDIFSCRSILYFTVGDIHVSTSHLQSSDILSAETISESQLRTLTQESPFSHYLIVRDMNHGSAHRILGHVQNNRSPTHGTHILDYILEHGYQGMRTRSGKNQHLLQQVRVIPMDLTEVSDHYPIEAILHPP